MKLGLWLRLIWLVGAYCGCGGSEFLVGVFPDAGAGELDLEDAAQPAHPMMTTDGSTSGGDAFKLARHDAGAPPPELEAGAVDSLAPAADAEPSHVGDASEEPPPPPPALCCVTPCSGSSAAAIACSNAPAWTCAAGSCADRACALGAVCNWMGPTCTGRVEVCP